MQSEDKKITELYYPRKCSATNKIIAAKDHASIQLNIPKVNEAGQIINEFETFALAGFIRSKGNADASLNRLMFEKGLISFNK